MHPAKRERRCRYTASPDQGSEKTPLRDAEMIRTQTDEREVQTMNPYNQTNNLAEVSQYESIR